MEHQEATSYNLDLNNMSSGPSHFNRHFDAKQDELKAEPLDTTDKDELIEITHICKVCLNITELQEMQHIYFDNISCIDLYQDFLNIKVGTEYIPALICTSCVANLKSIHNFIKMMKNSYVVLDEAAKKIKLLTTKMSDFTSSNYRHQVSDVLKNILSENTYEMSQNLSINSASNSLPGFLKSDVCEDNASDEKENLSSDDDTPILEKFRMLHERQSKKVLKLNKEKSELPKRRGRPKKNPNKNIALPVPDDNIESHIENEYFGTDSCQLCLKSFRNISQHMRSVHFLDWEHSQCLKCLTYEENRDELIAHCLSCFKDEVGHEFKSEFNVSVNIDPDFEPDEPDKTASTDEEFDNYYDKLDSSVEKEHRKRRQRRYTCNKCEDVSFSKYEQIESHLKYVHTKESKCILCSLQFNNSFSLSYHMMVKHGKLKCCRLCLISFKSSEELNNHYKSDEHNTKCTVCGEQFKNRKAVYEHRRKKHLNPQSENQKFKCPECPREFANSNNIRRHILVAHNDLRFLCDTCGQSYTTKRNLTIHIQKFHQGIQVENKPVKKNFFCESCGRELRIFHKYAIALHRAKHKGHTHVCKRCYDSFASEEEFKTHVKEYGHQLFECDKCQSQFVREENFKIHLKNHDAPGWNKNMFATWGKSAKLRNDKGEFVCSYCPKVFKDKQRLDNHVRVHTNERPYKCHICSKGFKTWIHRKTHLNIHLGIKKWTCKFCSKAFTNSCTLKGHEMIHTGERPHRCPECRKGFITMSAMKKHRMVHFKTGPAYDTKKPKNMDEKLEIPEIRNDTYLYKYGTLYTGSDASFEDFNEPPKDSTISLGPIEKELSC